MKVVANVARTSLKNHRVGKVATMKEVIEHVTDPKVLFYDCLGKSRLGRSELHKRCELANGHGYNVQHPFSSRSILANANTHAVVPRVSS